MIPSRDPNATRVVTLPSDITEPKSQFMIGMIPGRMFIKLFTEYLAAGAISPGAAVPTSLTEDNLSLARDLIRYGLKGATNAMEVTFAPYVNAQGKWTGVDDDTIDALYLKQQIELAELILEMNLLKEADKKNSGAPSSSSAAPDSSTAPEQSTSAPEKN